MRYEVWNKIDPIKGYDFNYWQNSLKFGENDGVFIVFDAYDNIRAVEVDRTIKAAYEMDPNLTTEEVAQEYIRIKLEEKEVAKTRAIQAEQNEERIVEIVKECMKAIFESANIELPEVLK